MKKLLSLVLVLCMVLSMSVSAFAEGTAVSVSTADELVEALAAGSDVVFANDIEMEAATTAPYGNKYGIKLDGAVLDGANHELYVEFYGDDYGIMTSGGTIKNVTIEEGCRAIMVMYPTEDVIIDNVKIGGDGVLYPINTGEAGAAGLKLVVTNSTLAGWTSFELFESASFTNVSFKQGTYYNNIYGRVVKPYVSTTFTNCSFTEHMNLDLSALKEGEKVSFTNCTVNGTPVTADVFQVPATDEEYDTLLFSVDLPSWATSMEDCVETAYVAPEPTPEVPVEKEEEYKSIIASTENGSVSVDDKKVTRGEKVTITVTPDKGYELAALSVIDEDGNERKLTENENGTFSFRMPEGGVTIEAEFAKIGAVETAPSTEKENPSTGASDFVGAAAALAVVSVMGMAALSIKR